MKTKKHYIFLLLTFINLTIFSQTMNWQFLKNAGGTSNDYCNDMCNDKNGNTIIVGESTSSTVTFDNITYNNPSGSYPISAIIAKYDSTGNLMWSKNYQGSYGAYKAVNSVAVDSVGNILVIGSFGGDSLKIDNTTLINNSAHADFFVAKFDPSGNLFWAKNFGGWSYDYGTSIAIDINNDVLITGYFYADTLKMDSITLLNPNTGCFGDVFVAKINSITGNTIWANRAGGYGKDISNCINSDKFGNIYIAGESQISTPMNFGNINLSTAGFSGMFMAKYDNNGQILWAKKAGGTFKDAFYDLVIDNNGNIYATGRYVGNASFDTIILPYIGWDDAFVCKYNTSGNVIWAKAITSSQNDIATKICHNDNNGNIYVSGFTENPFLVYGSDTINTQHGIFVLKLNAQGDTLYFDLGISSGYARSSVVSIDKQNNLHLAGSYTSKSLTFAQNSILNFDPLVSNYTTDIFTTKNNLNGYVTAIKSMEILDTEYDIYPNPSNDYFSISRLKGKSTISIIDVNGNYILEEKVNISSKIDIQNIKPGMYFIKIEAGASIFYKKLIIAR
jgi:hypothetical protein